MAIPSMSSATTTRCHSLRKLRSSSCKNESFVRNVLHKNLRATMLGGVTSAHDGLVTAVVEDDVASAQLKKLRCSENQTECQNAHSSDTSKTCLDESASEACQRVRREGERTSKQIVSFPSRQK